jgi:threonine dehydrogenase-like Zn-dependent dehydrogenase
MHMQRAIEITGHPRKIVATNLNRHRMVAVRQKFAAPAKDAGIELVTYSQDSYAGEAELDADLRHETNGAGYDDIAVMAPSVPAIELAMNHLADKGVMNVFAGLPRGTHARFNANDIVKRGVRFTGTSGSSIEDLAHMRDLIENKQLATNKSVNAVAGLEGVADGLAAVAEGRFPGKVVIFPNLSQPLPLTPLPELQQRLPSVYAKLGEGESWSKEAEEELLRLLL